jgi:acyl dehydratase
MSTQETVAGARAALTELAPGDEMPSAGIGPISRTDIVRYAGAGGDFNPIHHDEPMAQGFGLPGVFSMGMLQGGALAQRLARWVGPANVQTFTLRFTGQVWPGDELTLAGRVEDVDDGVATLTLTAARQDGDVVIKAAATARVA